MPPATRRSSGFGSNGRSPSNLDHILEHFNQFKRKHITQNRDIIKTNALAQLRIKELEDKVLALEAERSERSSDLIRLQAQVQRAEKAVLCVHQGWRFIGAGMAALSSIEGFEEAISRANASALSSSTDAAERRDHTVVRGGRSALGGSAAGSGRDFEDKDAILRGLNVNDAVLRPSIRITLDPNALPAGVARNVARPPEAQLNDVAEEVERDAETSVDEGASEARNVTLPVEDESTRDEETAGYDGQSNSGDTEGNGDEDRHDTVSFSADEEENTIRIVNDASANNGSGSIYHDRTSAQQDYQSEVRISSSSSTTSTRLANPNTLQVRRMTSIDSLSSFADEDEIELSTDEEQSVLSRRSAAPSKMGNGNLKQSLASTSYGEQNGERDLGGSFLNTDERSRTNFLPFGAPLTTLGSYRKRKTPESPSEMRLEDVSSEALTACEQEDGYSRSGSESPVSMTRSSRRSSMRDRKSVNYALPKLNTKMRKPDPLELVPAEQTERRKDTTGADSSSSDGNNMSNMEGGDGDGRLNTIADGQQSVSQSPEGKAQARQSKLRGRSEVASTGNLRELRKQHQLSVEKQQLEEAKFQNQDAKDKEASDELQGSEKSEAEPSESESPRRRSPRKSVRRESSSDGLSVDDAVGVQGSDSSYVPSSEGIRPSSSLTDEEEESHPSASEDADETIAMTKDRHITATRPSVLATPKCNSSSGTTASSMLSMTNQLAQSSSMRTAPFAGTPIPKSGSRPGQQGGIKALNKVAGRMQPKQVMSGNGARLPSSASGHLPARSASTSSAPGGRATASSNMASSGPSSRILGVSAKSNATPRAVSGGGGPSSSSTGPTSAATEAAKRGSGLHAAMTLHDIASHAGNGAGNTMRANAVSATPSRARP